MIILKNMTIETTKDNHPYNTRLKTKSQPRKRYKESSDNSSSSSNEESDNDCKNEKPDSNAEYSRADYHQLLAELFPSNFSREKAKISKDFANKYKKFKFNPPPRDSKPDNLDNLIILNISPKKKTSNNESSDNESSDNESSDNESTDNESRDNESSDNESSDNESSDNERNRRKNKEIFNKFKELANKLGTSDKNNKLLKTLVKENKKKQEYLQKKTKQNESAENIEKIEKRKNHKKFVKLLDSKENIADEKFFMKNLTLIEQNKLLEDLSIIHNSYNSEKPYLITLLEKKIPNKFKAIALSKINTIKQMAVDKSSSEYNKLKSWVDAFMRIPFDDYKTLPISINDGLECSNEFILSAKKQLDSCVFGLEDAKLQILQLLGQWIVNPSSVGTAIAIHGPMGTGKTSLVRDGISKILNRPFAFIPLGGATDASTLEGHGYTYEGSTYGKIVDILIQCKTMNPIIMFDELDKVSDTPKGEEIIGILTHLTDPTQNSEFHDKYFSEIDFDLSKCLFIFSYNDDQKINPILKDRLYKIQTKGYNKNDKIIIANKYLLPLIQNVVKLNNNEIIIPDNILECIINKYTAEEKGVRNFKRCLEIIYTKLNLLRLIKPENNNISKELDIKVNFPLTITEQTLNKLLTKLETSTVPFGMYN